MSFKHIDTVLVRCDGEGCTTTLGPMKPKEANPRMDMGNWYVTTLGAVPRHYCPACRQKPIAVEVKQSHVRWRSGGPPDPSLTGKGPAK